MSEVVRRERRDSCGLTGSRDSRSETVSAEASEDLRREVAILARHECDHGREHVRGNRNPSGLTRLRRRGPYEPTSIELVNIAPGERLKLADAHPRRVEHEHRKAKSERHRPTCGENVRRRRRIDLLALLAR